MSTGTDTRGTDYTRIYDPDLDFDARYTRATAARITPHLKPGARVLECGAATGLMTAALAGAGARVTALDRSRAYLDRLEDRDLPGVTPCRLDLDEDELPTGPFDHVVATNLLHELPDPAAFLRRAAAVLAPDGTMHVSVPNPGSLHRLVALEMGLLENLDGLSDRADRFSTRRMLTREDLDRLAREAGLTVATTTGVLCKPLPNALMEELPDEVLDGLDAVSHRVPDLCAMTLVTLRHAEPVPQTPLFHAPRRARARTPARTVTVIGGTVAGLVAADALARAGRRVALHLPETGVGGGFTALHRDGRRLELGVRLLELGYEDDPAVVPPLAAYVPGFGGHRHFTPLVRDWVRGLVGDRLVDVEPPRLVFEGRSFPDLHFSVDLTGLPAVIGTARAAMVAVEARRAIAAHGPRGIDLAADPDLTLAAASLADHGPTFHDLLIAPLADKFLQDGAHRTLATWRRKVWMPLFWPQTVEEACGPGGPSFRPRRRFETVADVDGADGGPGAIVGALRRRLERSPLVELRPLGGHTVDSGSLVALTLREMAAAAGHVYAPERARSVLAWIEAEHDGPFPLTHVADAGNPVARVSDSGPGVRPGTRVLVVELRHDVPKERISAEARAGLCAAGLFGAREVLEVQTVLTGAQPTFDAPTAATRDAHAAALAHVAAALPSDRIVGPAAAPGADSFNEQVVAGLAAAEDLT